MERFLLYFLVYFIEALIAYEYLNHLFPCRKGRFSTFIGYLFCYGLQIVIYYLNIPLLNGAGFFLLNALLVYLLYSRRISSILLHTAVLASLMGFSEIIASNLAGGLFARYRDIYMMSSTESSILIIISKSLYFFLSQLIVRFYKYRYDTDRKLSQGLFSLITIPMFSMVIPMSLIYVCSHNDLTQYSEYIIAIISVLLLLLNILIVWLYDYSLAQSHKLTQLQLIQQRTSDAESYLKLIGQQDEEQKILIHDMKNHLQTIYALNSDGQTDKVGEYLQNLITTTALNRSYAPTNSDYLNLLLARYANICDQKEISLDIDGKQADLQYLALEDITALFGNLLDNAIEACQRMEQAHIELRLTGKSGNAQTVVTLVNSCRVAPAITKDHRFLSTKRNASLHGLGTISIRHTIEKYHGTMETYFDPEEAEFHTIILMNPPMIG